ncbi:MAG: succinate dehydrogenase, hydrophobic membrane anchor protein [bacterium]
MPRSKHSKKTGSTQWMMVRISGVILLGLLLAHFWVHHFFIKDFYGQVNIVDLQPKKSTISDYLPIDTGGESHTYISSINKELKGTSHYLDANKVKKIGSASITILQSQKRTEIFHGTLTKKEISNSVDRELVEPTILHKQISPKQIKTKRMINYDDVHERVGGDGWIWWKTYNLLFLILALYHGLVGIWDVLVDYQMRPLIRFTIYGVLNTLGLVLFIVGTLIIVPM